MFDVVNIKNVSYKMGRNVCDLSKQRTTIIASIALLLSHGTGELNVYFRCRNAVVFHYAKYGHNKSSTDCFSKMYLSSRKYSEAYFGSFVFMVFLKISVI